MEEGKGLRTYPARAKKQQQQKKATPINLGFGTTPSIPPGRVPRPQSQPKLHTPSQKDYVRARAIEIWRAAGLRDVEVKEKMTNFERMFRRYGSGLIPALKKNYAHQLQGAAAAASASAVESAAASAAASAKKASAEEDARVIAEETVKAGAIDRERRMYLMELLSPRMGSYWVKPEGEISRWISMPQDGLWYRYNVYSGETEEMTPYSGDPEYKRGDCVWVSLGGLGADKGPYSKSDDRVLALVESVTRAADVRPTYNLRTAQKYIQTRGKYLPLQNIAESRLSCSAENKYRLRLALAKEISNPSADDREVLNKEAMRLQGLGKQLEVFPATTHPTNTDAQNWTTDVKYWNPETGLWSNSF